jgi:drug/metabolite transporter (DMT)-like permease
MDRANTAVDPEASRSPLTAVRSPDLGIVFVLVFLVLSNTNAVFAGNLLQSVQPFIFLFWSFLAASLTFGILLVIRKGLAGLAISRSAVVPLLALNATTALTWIGFYYALRFIAPAIVTAIMGGLGPLTTIALQRFLHWRQLPPRIYLAATGVLVGAALLAWAALTGQSGVREVTISVTLVGLGAATIGGIFQALNTMATKRLGEKGLTATQIMSHRFYLLIAIAAVLSLAGPGLSPGPASRAGLIAIATILGVIAPLWPLQRGILLSEPFTVAALLACSPIITFLFQGFDRRVHWSAASAAGCAVVAVFTIYGTRLIYRKAPTETPD